MYSMYRTAYNRVKIWSDEKKKQQMYSTYATNRNILQQKKNQNLKWQKKEHLICVTSIVMTDSIREQSVWRRARKSAENKSIYTNTSHHDSKQQQ